MGYQSKMQFNPDPNKQTIEVNKSDSAKFLIRLLSLIIIAFLSVRVKTT